MILFLAAAFGVDNRLLKQEEVPSEVSKEKVFQTESLSVVVSAEKRNLLVSRSPKPQPKPRAVAAR